MDRKLAVYSFLIGTGALLVCLVMFTAFLPLLGGSYEASVFAGSVLICYGVASPVAYFHLRQSESLRAAGEQLSDVRHELASAQTDIVEKLRTDGSGLLRHEYFMEAFELQGAANPVNTLLVIETDHLKNIRAQYGALTSDRVLSTIGQEIMNSVRAQDVVGHMGGEEFGVFLPNTDRSDACIVAERIRGRVAEFDFRRDGESPRLPLSVSIGGIISATESDRSQMLALADRNLSSAKQAGRNRIVVGKLRRRDDIKPIAA